jgi:glyoxylase-like metal-dependent hydrolase (beta-lactamase superfamily II)
MPALPDHVLPLGDGLFQIDTGFHRPHFDAAYLLVHEGRAAFIDAGTNHAVPRLLSALDALGLARDAVDHVIPTHVHLDHAGGIGLLMRELPAATLWVHPRGLRHLVDPGALYQGALAVYGQEEMDRSYGQLLPVPAERARATADGMRISLAGRELEVADTPGHAKHHHCLWDAASGGWFTGDTFGLSYREFDSAQGPFVIPTTTPVQFEPEALHASVQRLLAKQPRWMYLTHYGRVGGGAGDVSRLAARLLAQTDAMVALARSVPAGPQRHAQLCDGLWTLYRDGLRAHGVTPDADTDALLALDVELNAQGLAVWLDRGSR